MPSARATRELLAPREDVWAFVSEPFHLPDWWPGIASVEPDRRGFAEGARWTVRRGARPGLLRRPSAEGLLVLSRIVPYELVAWHLTAERLDATLWLEDAGAGRTAATLEVEAAWLLGLPRKLPRQALGRLHALCQTAAGL